MRLGARGLGTIFVVKGFEESVEVNAVGFKGF